MALEFTNPVAVNGGDHCSFLYESIILSWKRITSVRSLPLERSFSFVHVWNYNGIPPDCLKCIFALSHVFSTSLFSL